MKTAFMLVVFTLLTVACATPASELNVQQVTDPTDIPDETANNTVMDETHTVPDIADEANNAAALTLGDLEVTTSDVAYFGDVTGYLAQPSTSGDYPGVVMIHEWWGLNEHIKASARALASHGYRVLAVDIYEGEVATERADAQRLSGSVNQARAVENMEAAVAYLRSSGSARIASYGWCFGGKQSLQLSLSEPLDATVIYYGQLETDPSVLEQIDGPVLGIFGSADSSIPVSSVIEFQEGLTAAGVENSVQIYDGVGHAFANPSGANFAPNETDDAWERTLDFLGRLQ
jgi:carboxymethylenebutenolidase